MKAKASFSEAQMLETSIDLLDEKKNRNREFGVQYIST